MSQRVRSTVLVGALAVLAWPHIEFRAAPGLDPSWVVGNTFAHVQGLTYGDDIVFNYGPLGFIVYPIVGGGRWFFLGVVGTVVLTLAFASSLFAALRLQGVGRRTAFAVLAVILLVAPMPAAELVVLAMGLVLTLAVWHRVRFGTVFWIACGALAGSLMLVKVSTGPVLLVVALLAAAVDPLRIRRIGAVVGAFAGAVLGWWLALGQGLGDIVEWARGAAAIASGHTSAMSIGTPGGAWQYAALAVVLLIAAGLVAPTVRALPDADRTRRVEVLVAIAIVAALGWFFVKQGFVRRDAHAGDFFLHALIAMVVLVPWFPGGRPVPTRPGDPRASAAPEVARTSPGSRTPQLALGAAGLVCVIAATVILGRPFLRSLDPLRPVIDVATTTELLASQGARRAAALDANAEARAVYALPQEILDRVGDAPVHVDPNEITLAWAYGLNWRPIVTMQRYVGYTRSLDRRNAAELIAADGPRYVIRERYGSIDHRFPLLDGPAATVALVCNFRSVFDDGVWQLFERAPMRCGALVEQQRTRLGPGEVLAVPTPEPDPALPGAATATLVSVEYDRGILEALATLVLKPPSSPELILDGQTFRLLPTTSATPGLVALPPSGPLPPAFERLDAGSFRLGVDRPATVTVFTMTIDQ